MKTTAWLAFTLIGALIGAVLADHLGFKGSDLIVLIGAAAGGGASMLLYSLVLRPYLKALEMSLLFAGANSGAEC